ncbi:MAG: hypothetical protein JWR15_3852 [Prosthecobacter sp.]|nr:hypothetical protein [Prosthecobacter sp.]
MTMRCALLIAALAILFALSGCHAPQESTYTYTAHITTGIGHYIMVDGKEEPVLFSDSSDPMARWSLCHLKSEVIHAAGNQITVTGTVEKRVPKPEHYETHRQVNGQTVITLEPEAHLLFKITGWKLKTPFNMYHWALEGAFPLERRDTLRRDDFSSSEDFDPMQPGFDPSKHLER